MKQQERKQVFRRSVSGYNKEDVNSFILTLDRQAQDGLAENRQAFRQEQASLEEQLAVLREQLRQTEAEKVQLQAAVDRLRQERTSLQQQKEEQLLAFAQIVSEMTELRKRLAEKEQAPAEAALPAEVANPPMAAEASPEKQARSPESAPEARPVPTVPRITCSVGRLIRPVLRRKEEGRKV